MRSIVIPSMEGESSFTPPVLLVLAFLGTWPSHCITLANQGDCRKLSFPAFFFFANKRLMNHVIRTEQVTDMDTCEMLCFNEHNCVSCNFENNANNADGTHKCELNNSTHREHDGDFLDSAGFFYRGADENACGSSPCPNGASCQSGFTNKLYRCLCPAGFTGEHCEQDINECDDGVHDCLASRASCMNTWGSFNCSCNHGYIGDGKTNCTEAPECYNFTSLDEADRKPSFPVNMNSPKNDRNLGPGWFRFQGDAGSMMTTSCIPKETCNTAATGWLNGSHPEVTDGIVTRKVCFSYNECCEWHTIIQVRNCGDFFAYFFGRPDSSSNGAGSLRYCGSD